PDVRCAECHEDPHGSRFDGVAMPQVLEGREGCARCHGMESFNEIPSGRFDHSVWTAFALEGSHQQVRCTECHGADESGNLVLGTFEKYGHGDPRVVEVPCEACHDDPHGDAFRGSATPLSIEGREGCARCHGDLTFRDTPAFRHEFTGHVLEGVHADLTCVACHGTHTSQPQRLTTRLQPAEGKA
ncbi:MAG: hypothetical protein KDB61_16820, partial [Planctomycetes bacterium]|nr:hypothetical protein [Planctomycetota bacterium]